MKGRPIGWTADELRWVARNRDLPRAQLRDEFAARFDRPGITVSALAGLCKRHGWMTGRTGRYAPGRVPENKGKPRPWNENSARHQFQPGNIPHTARGAGHESVDGDGYVWIIIDAVNPHTGAATRRVQKHRHLWEQAHGPLPEDHVLKCLDGDKSNCAPENWRLLPRAMLPRLNGRFGRDYDSAPDEIKPLILATATLEHRARLARKEQK